MQPGSPELLIAIGVLSFALAFIGAAVGLILGHLRLPMLIAYFGSPTAGAMTNLMISGAGALGGAARHVREGRVSWNGVALMGIPSVIGAVGAVYVFVHIDPVWSYLAIGAMLLVSGINLIKMKTDERPAEPITRLRRMVFEFMIGLVFGGVGAITGLMLGSLRLPMMIRYLRMDPKEAIGTNMVVGCLTAAAGSLTGLIESDGRIDWLVMAAVVPPTLAGGWLGAWLTGRISKLTVQRFAGWIITVTGVCLLTQGMNGAMRRLRPTQSVSSYSVIEELEDEWPDYDIVEDIPLPPTVPIPDDEEEEEEDPPAQASNRRI